MLNVAVCNPEGLIRPRGETGLAGGSGTGGKESQNSIIMIFPHCLLTPLPVVLLL